MIFFLNSEFNLILGEAGGSKLSNVLKAKEDMQKSPEQLEKEKREIIASRLVRLDLNGKNKDDLVKAVSSNIRHIYIYILFQDFTTNRTYSYSNKKKGSRFLSVLAELALANLRSN